eukprot:TRINITY_DN14268_c0_g1_i1.p1 TRINITY_DN14268_c0_g1~~TRINITY_DN14268_c0_g1_i1.p1  ORF type:complete len:739 (+),score=124.38 TRINITY_DN14268_c0_g1_i1:105-2219(+)
MVQRPRGTTTPVPRARVSGGHSAFLRSRSPPRRAPRLVLHRSPPRGASERSPPRPARHSQPVGRSRGVSPNRAVLNRPRVPQSPRRVLQSKQLTGRHSPQRGDHLRQAGSSPSRVPKRPESAPRERPPARLDPGDHVEAFRSDDRTWHPAGVVVSVSDGRVRVRSGAAENTLQLSAVRRVVQVRPAEHPAEFGVCLRPELADWNRGEEAQKFRAKVGLSQQPLWPFRCGDRVFCTGPVAVRKSDLHPVLKHTQGRVVEIDADGKMVKVLFDGFSETRTVGVTLLMPVDSTPVRQPRLSAPAGRSAGSADTLTPPASYHRHGVPSPNHVPPGSTAGSAECHAPRLRTSFGSPPPRRRSSAGSGAEVAAVLSHQRARSGRLGCLAAPPPLLTDCALPVTHQQPRRRSIASRRRGGLRTLSCSSAVRSPVAAPAPTPTIRGTPAARCLPRQMGSFDMLPSPSQRPQLQPGSFADALPPPPTRILLPSPCHSPERVLERYHSGSGPTHVHTQEINDRLDATSPTNARGRWLAAVGPEGCCDPSRPLFSCGVLSRKELQQQRAAAAEALQRSAPQPLRSGESAALETAWQLGVVRGEIRPGLYVDFGAKTALRLPTFGGSFPSGALPFHLSVNSFSSSPGVAGRPPLPMHQLVALQKCPGLLGDRVPQGMAPEPLLLIREEEGEMEEVEGAAEELQPPVCWLAALSGRC